VVGGRALFVGGSTGSVAWMDLTPVVDVYDAATGQWTTGALSQLRRHMAVATVGTRVLFAGGTIVSSGPEQHSAAVDIYDSATGQWSTAALSQARAEPAVA